MPRVRKARVRRAAHLHATRPAKELRLDLPNLWRGKCAVEPTLRVPRIPGVQGDLRGDEMNPDPRGTDFARHRFTQRIPPRLPISGPVGENVPRTPLAVDVAVFLVCAACALVAWWLP